MRLGRYEITREPGRFAIARRSPEEEQKAASVVPTERTFWGWLNRVLEPFAGAWQRNIENDRPKDILAFSAVYACVTMIASDIAKLRIKLMEYGDDDIGVEINESPYLPVLRKPNRYQNRIRFVEQWILSKLIHGNFYAIKQRDERGIVKALYPLDPQRVKTLFTEDGGVYYELAVDHLSGLRSTVTAPASEIIHDMMPALFHPLAGVSPLYACAQTATQGRRIQNNSTKFFDNMSRPSGVLTAKDTIDDVTAARLKREFEENFSGGNIGRVAVLGDGLSYSPMAIPAREAQLIDQLKWTIEDVARSFRVPLFKVGGAVPANNTVGQLNQIYYDDCLQTLIESLELCLDEGLELKKTYFCELDLDGLLRMDQAALITAEAEATKAGIKKIDEARKRLNLKPVPGGDSPYLQQQNYSLEALAKRDARPDPFAAPKPAEPAPERLPAPDANEDADADASANERAADEMRALLETLDKGLELETN